MREPAGESPTRPTTRAPAPPARSRLVGIDAARGLAVLGMIVVHVAVAGASAGGAGAAVSGLAQGRSAILFAVLAGVSLGLLSGGRRGWESHRAGERPPGDRTRIAVRAAVLFVLGLALAAISTGPMVILCYYAVMFVLMLPWLWVRPAALWAWAAGWALLGPVVSFALRSVIRTDTVGGAIVPGDLTSWASAGQAALRLVLTGAYPVATWMPFLLAGLAIGRLDLRDAVVRARVFAAGVGAALLGYGGSWLAIDVLGGRQALLRAVAPAAGGLGMSPEQVVDLLSRSGLGTTGTLSPAFLLTAAAHSGTTFEIVGSGGVAVAVVAACSALAGRGGRVIPVVLWPLAAVGTLAASLYAAHIAAMALLTAAWPGWQEAPWRATLLFLVAALVLACVWRRTVGRGPVELLLHTLSARAAGSR